MRVRQGDKEERYLSWLDWTIPHDISADGSTVLFDESGFGGGERRVEGE